MVCLEVHPPLTWTYLKSGCYRTQQRRYVCNFASRSGALAAALLRTSLVRGSLAACPFRSIAIRDKAEGHLGSIAFSPTTCHATEDELLASCLAPQWITVSSGRDIPDNMGKCTADLGFPFGDKLAMCHASSRAVLGIDISTAHSACHL